MLKMLSPEDIEKCCKDSPDDPKPSTGKSKKNQKSKNKKKKR